MGISLKETLPPILAAKGISQEDLAKLTGIRRTDINAICRGRIQVGVQRLERIAAALEISPLDLAPQQAGSSEYRSFSDRLAELEDVLEELGPELQELGRRVAVLETQSRPRARKPANGSGH